MIEGVPLSGVAAKKGPLWLLILLAFSNPYHQYGPLLLEDCELQEEKPDVEATRLVGKFMLADLFELVRNPIMEAGVDSREKTCFKSVE